MKLKRLTELSLLTAVALIIFVVELRFPDILPIQGMKLGLANIITVYAVFVYQPSETAMIVACRVLLGAMFSGTMISLFYSASGAVMCLLGMLILKKFLSLDYIWLCSVIGAIFHNIGQICAAMLMMRSTAVIWNLPPLILFGAIAGLFTGLCAQVLLKRMNNIKKL